jgi:hypothetical protein
MIGADDALLLQRPGSSFSGPESKVTQYNSRSRIAAMRQAEGTAEAMGKYVIATIMRKTDNRLADQFHVVVRSSTIPDDKTIAVSQEDYDHLYPGMLVTVFKVGWGPLSAWWLRR